MTSARLLTLILTALFFISATLAGAGDARAEAARAAHARMDERLIASIPTYDLVIRLVPDSHQMEVTGTILLPASGETRPTITLVLSSLMSDLRVELLEEGGTGVHVDATVEASDAKAGPTRWTLHPPNPIPANKPVRFRLTYASHDGTAFSFYIGPEGSFAGNGSGTRWYPQLPDNAARGTGQLRFEVPPGYVVLSNGAKHSSAASEGEGRFAFVNTVPTEFAFAAAKYTVMTRGGVVPMRLYLLRPRENAKEYVDGAAAALATLAREFGPYPYDGFSIAEVPTEQADKAGFSGASMNGFMLSNTTQLDLPFNMAFYGHEISHQWWGNLVTRAGTRGRSMMDEAMAQFGALRCVEIIEGSVAAETFRREGYPGNGSSQSGYEYLMSTELGEDYPLADMPGQYRSHELATTKGFMVLDLLSRTVGRARFRSVLRTITRRYAFRGVRWEEFIGMVQKASPQDLKGFVSEWLERTGAPDWQVTWEQRGDEVRGGITQSAPLYHQALDVELRGRDGQRAIHHVLMAGARTSFRWHVAFRVSDVVADPHFVVLHWLPELKDAAHARGPALRAFRLADRGKTDEASAELQKALANLPSPDVHGARFWTDYALAYVEIKRKNWTGARELLDAALAAPTRDAESLPWLYWRYAHVAKDLHDDARLKEAVEGAASSDAALGGRTAAPYLARALLKPSS